MSRCVNEAATETLGPDAAIRVEGVKGALMLAEVEADLAPGCGCWIGAVLRFAPDATSAGATPVLTAGQLREEVQKIQKEVACDGKTTASHGFPSCVWADSPDVEDDLVVREVIAQNGSLTIRLAAE